MIPAPQTAKRLFKAMPDRTRKAIVNQIINVQGLKMERSKEHKQSDRETYGQPNRGERNFLPLLFEHSVKQHISKTIQYFIKH